MTEQAAPIGPMGAMRRWASCAGSTAILVMSVSLAGCINFDSSFSGVPLDEIDMGSTAPVEFALAGPDDVFLTVGETFNIEVEGDDEAVDDLRFKLDGNSLTVGREGNWMESEGKATIRVTMPAPRSLSLAGSGDIAAETLAETAEVSLAGSGKINVASIEADDLDVSVAGSGLLSAVGTAKSLGISIAGSGDIDFAGLNADKAEISIAGSGDVELASDGEVEASIAGSGDVRVTGNASCQSSSVGSGNVTCRPSKQTAGAAAADPEAPASSD